MTSLCKLLPTTKGKLLLQDAFFYFHILQCKCHLSQYLGSEELVNNLDRKGNSITNIQHARTFFLNNIKLTFQLSCNKNYSK